MNIVSTSCDTALDPFMGVTFIEVRVTGTGIETPLLTRVARSEGRIQIPQIPAGEDRIIEVRGLAEETSQRPISIGRSLPFKIPDVLTDATRRIDINIFLRKIDSFTPPVSAAAPRDCATMRSQRAAHSATLLKDGRVFIAGGFRLEGANRIALVDTEFFDPNKGTFEQGPVLSLSGGTQLPKAFHTATLLRNGQVLLYGGERYTAGTANPLAQSTVLIFDVEQGAFGAVPSRQMPPPIARTHHLAIPEASGRVLIVGGQRTSSAPPPNNISAVNEVEFFDPNTNRVEVVMSEMLPRVDATGSSVQDGGVLVVAGGVDGAGAVTDTVNFYKFDGSTFIRAGATQQLRTARRGAAAMTLADDKTILVAGGYTNATMVVPEASSEAIKTANNTIEPATATIGERGDACAAILQQGNVLVVGGRKVGGMSDGSATLIRYDVDKATLTAAAASPMSVPRYLHTCTTLADGSVLVTGGISDPTGTTPVVQRDAWIYTPIPGE